MCSGGRRLGKAAFNQVYGGAAAVSGPTIYGCALAGTALTVTFDPVLLKSSKVVVQPMATSSPAIPTMLQVIGAACRPFRERERDWDRVWLRHSHVTLVPSHLFNALQVLTNASLFCAEPLLAHTNVSCHPDPGNKQDPCRGKTWRINTFYQCFDGEIDGAVLEAARAAHSAMLGETGHPPACPFEESWVMVEAKLGTAPGTITIDTSKLNGTVAGVRYGWVGDCNIKNLPGTPNLVENCPLMSSEGLPANPWMAKVVGGKCACMPPQKC